MNVTAIPTSVTFFPTTPAAAPAAFVPLMPDQADLRSQTDRILALVQDGRIDTFA